MQLQVFNLDGSLYETFSKFHEENFSFSNTLGSGQAGLRLSFNRNTLDLHGKFVRLHIQEKNVFTGYIDEETLKLPNTTVIDCVGLFGLLNRYQSRTNYELYPSSVIHAYYDLKDGYGSFISDTYDVIDSGESGDTTIFSSYITHDRIISDVINESGYDFFLGADGKFRFQENISTTVHNISIGNEIIGGSLGKSMRDYRSQVQGQNATGTFVEGPHTSDSASQYGLSQQFITSSSNDNYISLQTMKGFSEPKNSAVIEVIGDIFNYEVGDMVTINNSPITIENVKIQKIVFTRNKATLYLDTFKSVAKNIG